MVQTASPRDPTRRFSDRVEYYVRSRPRYPQILLEFCRHDLALEPRHSIADVGSGTGFLSELFLANGNPVSAVEPNPEMRQAAENALSRFPNFHSVNATAEATGLPDHAFNFVTAGQAFHWFDLTATRREFSRILTPDGWVLLIWNERRAGENGFDHDYDQLISRYATDQTHVRRQSINASDSKTLSEFFHPGNFQTRQFENPQSLDLDGVLARALSSSYLPLPGQPGCDKMLAELRDIFAKHANNGRVIQRYDAKLFYGRLQ